MAKIKISALEQAVILNIVSLGVNKEIPQKILSSQSVKNNQVSAVVNNMVLKGLVSRQKDLFGTNISLTRSGKIQSTKIINTRLAA